MREVQPRFDLLVNPIKENSGVRDTANTPPNGWPTEFGTKRVVEPTLTLVSGMRQTTFHSCVLAIGLFRLLEASPIVLLR
jgi:hypothetical protein